MNGSFTLAYDYNGIENVDMVGCNNESTVLGNILLAYALYSEEKLKSEYQGLCNHVIKFSVTDNRIIESHFTFSPSQFY